VPLSERRLLPVTPQPDGASACCCPIGRYRKIRCCGGEPCKHCRTGRRACLYVSVAEWQSFHKGVRVDHPPDGQERSSASASPPSASRAKPYPSTSSVLGKRTRSETTTDGADKGKKKAQTMNIARSQVKMTAAPPTSTPSLRSSVSVAEPSSTPSSSSAGSGVYSGYYSPAGVIGPYAPSYGADYESSASSAAPSRETTPEAAGLPYHVPAPSVQIGSVYHSGPPVSFRSPWPTAAARIPAGTASPGRASLAGPHRLEYPRPYEHSGPPSPFLLTHPVHQHSYYAAVPEAERPLNIAGWVPLGSEPTFAAFDGSGQPSTTPPSSSTMPASLGQAAGFYLGFTSQDLDRILRSYASLLPATSAPQQAAGGQPPSLATVGRKPSVSYNSAAEADLSVLREFGLGASYATLDDRLDDGAGEEVSGDDCSAGPVETPAIEDLVVGLDAPAFSLPPSPTPDDGADQAWSAYGCYF